MKRVLNFISFLVICVSVMLIYKTYISGNAGVLGHGVIVILAISFFFLFGAYNLNKNSSSFAWGDNIKNIVHDKSEGTSISKTVNQMFSVCLSIVALFLVLFKFYTDFMV